MRLNTTIKQSPSIVSKAKVKTTMFLRTQHKLKERYTAELCPVYTFFVEVQKELLFRSLRNMLKLVFHYPFAHGTDLLRIANDELLEEYVKGYIRKRLEKICTRDLVRSPFYNDTFDSNSFLIEVERSSRIFFTNETSSTYKYNASINTSSMACTLLHVKFIELFLWYFLLFLFPNTFSSLFASLPITCNILYSYLCCINLEADNRMKSS